MKKLYVFTIALSVFGLMLWISPTTSAASCQEGYGADSPSSESTPAETPPDSDCDSVPDNTENSAPAHEATPGVEDPNNTGTNAGDNNADGTPDSEQSDVASFPNPNDTQQPDSYVTIEVTSNSPEYEGFQLQPLEWNITYVDPTLPSETPSDKTLPLGLFDLTLENPGLKQLIDFCAEYPQDWECIFIGNQEIAEQSTVEVRLLFNRVIDHSDWMVQKYVEGTFTNYTNATVQDEVVGFLRTTIKWTLTDGGTGDSDGVLNGEITDPIGPAVANPVTVAPQPQVLAAVTTVSSPQVATLANTGSQPFVAAYAAVLLSGAVLVVRSKKTV